MIYETIKSALVEYNKNVYGEYQLNIKEDKA